MPTEPSAETSSTSSVSSPSFARRALVTLIAPLIVWFLGERLLLPGIPADVVESMPGPHAGFGAFSLGIAPILSAYWIVEVVAFLVPPLARRRHGSPEVRSKLEGAARILAVALAALQAYGVAASLSVLGSSALVSGVRPHADPFVVLILVGGVCVQFIVAEIITRRGLMSGFVVLLGAEALRSWVEAVLSAFGVRSSVSFAPRPHGQLVHDLALGAAATAVVVVATAIALRGAGLLPPRSGAKSEGEARQLAIRPVLPIPASSHEPYVFATALFVLPASLSNVFPALRPAVEFLGDPRVALAVTLLLTIGLAGIFSRILHRAAEIETLAVRLGATTEAVRTGARAAFHSALLPTIAFFVALTLASFASSFGLLLVVPIVALVLDAAQAVRLGLRDVAWETVRDERRASAIPVLRAALAEAGIPTEVKGAHVLSLFQLFAPYAPAQILVRPEDVERARALLAPLVAVEASESALPKGTEPVPLARTNVSPTRRAALLAGCAGVALAAYGVSRIPTSAFRAETAHPSVPRTVLEIVRVDDTIHPFDEAEKAVPNDPGIDLRHERVPVGTGRYEDSTYAKLVLRPGETKAAATKRFRAWLDAIHLPKDARFGLEDVFEYDEDAGLRTFVGLRTLVLTGDSVVHPEDVADATVMDSGQGAGEPDVYVGVTLKPEAAKRFEELTREWTKRRLAIVVDGEVTSAPVIQTEIRGGHLSISVGPGGAERKLAEAERLVRGLTGR